jgi:transcriptional regulator with XRE-family HTH domain
MTANHLRADGADQFVMGVEIGSHASLYQRAVYISSGQTFIGTTTALMQKLGVANDPEFGQRLREAIEAAGYRNPRRFAIDGMGWDEQSGPQRLINYLKGRIPEVETLLALAEKLGTSVGALLNLQGVNSEADEGLKGILQHLLSLEGIDADKAGTIASVSLAAQRLLRAFPEDEPLPTRAKYAARAAWLQQQIPKTNR